MLLDGKWEERSKKITVTNPADGSVVDTVPQANEDDVKLALSSAMNGLRK